MSERKHIDVKQAGAVTVARFRHDKLVDLDTVFEASEELNRLVETERPKRLVLDFAGVRLVTSAVLAAVLSLTKRVKAIGGDIKFCGMAPVVYEVFAITELDKLLDIRDDEAAALGAFSQ
jgi:anti-anti-sigma factor